MKTIPGNLRFFPIVFQAAAFMFCSTLNAYAVEEFVPSKGALIGKVMLGKAMTLSETNMLEPVCIMIFASDQAAGGGGVWYEKLKGNPVLDRPENLIAKGAISFHHYCWAELHMARYYNARNSAEKKAELLSAYGDYSFMIGNPQWLPSSWPYLPKMYVKHGGAASMMGRDHEAITSFLKAKEIDPKFDRAYTSLADLTARNGNKSKALEYVTEGLKHNPESKRLKRRYTELGGKLPYPVPDTSPETENQGTTSSLKQQPPVPEHGADTSKDALHVTKPDSQSRQIQPQKNNETFGSPGNPYCRFCP